MIIGAEYKYYVLRLKIYSSLGKKPPQQATPIGFRYIPPTEMSVKSLESTKHFEEK